MYRRRSNFSNGVSGMAMFFFLPYIIILIVIWLVKYFTRKRKIFTTKDIIKETEKAYLIQLNPNATIWVAKQFIRVTNEKISIEVPEHFTLSVIENNKKIKYDFDEFADKYLYI